MLENIIALVTIVVSFFLGKLSKKSNFVKNELIPLQNLFVGIVVAVFFPRPDVVGLAYVVVAAIGIFTSG